MRDTNAGFQRGGDPFFAEEFNEFSERDTQSDRDISDGFTGLDAEPIAHQFSNPHFESLLSRGASAYTARCDGLPLIFDCMPQCNNSLQNDCLPILPIL